MTLTPGMVVQASRSASDGGVVFRPFSWTWVSSPHPISCLYADRRTAITRHLTANGVQFQGSRPRCANRFGRPTGGQSPPLADLAEQVDRLCVELRSKQRSGVRDRLSHSTPHKQADVIEMQHRLGIVLSRHADEDGATIFRQACLMGLEGCHVEFAGDDL
jgi:hypothetical protein